MQNNKVLQLTFPQWQGAPRQYATQAAPELPERDAIQGYMLGAKLMTWLLPENTHTKAIVPVDETFAPPHRTRHRKLSYR